ncbi:hypothetical protein BC940DRAFT_308272 [Gongronella butleri]|nr:hypothetical protein BC940DRAFT_308272 [Gongronella butleri]
MPPQNANNSSQDQADYRPMPPTPPPQQLAYTNNNQTNQPPAPAPPIASAPPAQPPAAAPQPPAKTNLPPTPNKPDDNTLHDEYASYLHLLPDELASPPRSPNPYNSNNQANGIKQVAFHNDQCEVFRWKDDSWYAVEGHCVLEIRQTYTNRSCIAIRLSSTGDLYLNAWILPHTMVNLASQTDVSIGVSMGQKRENYLIHFQAAGIAQQLEQVLQKEHQAAVVASRQLNGHQAQIGEPPTTPKDNRNSRNMVTTTSPQPTHADQQSMHPQQQHPQQQHAQNPQQQQMQQAQNPHQQQMQQMYPGQPINPQQQQANANAALMTRSSSLMHAGVEPKPIPQTLQKIMQCKCKLFMQNEHSNWSNLGTVLLIVSLQIPSQRMHIQIESDKKRGFSKIISGAGSNGSSASLSLSAPSSPRIPPSSSSASTGSDPSSSSTSLHDPTTPNTMVSATVYSNNVERIGPKRITFLLVNERERSSNVVYMVQFREEQTSNTLYEYLKVKNASHGW